MSAQAGSARKDIVLLLSVSDHSVTNWVHAHNKGGIPAPAANVGGRPREALSGVRISLLTLPKRLTKVVLVYSPYVGVAQGTQRERYSRANGVVLHRSTRLFIQKRASASRTGE